VTRKILISGACGRMGQEVVRTIVEDTDSIPVAAFDKKMVGEDIVDYLGLEGPECIVYDDLEKALIESKPQVVIDFTAPQVVMDNIEKSLRQGAHMIVGTTGISDTDMEKIEDWASRYQKNILIAPNFALGAVLLMEFAARAGKYFDDVEIIEMHHEGKLDAPSGTALKTAELINENRNKNRSELNEENKSASAAENGEFMESLKGARGGKKEGISIHSVRLPGLVAHQEVIFGGEGQTLTLRHDSIDRKSFMPGVRRALDKIEKLDGLVYGLEKILD